MLRRLQTVSGKNIDTMLASNVDLVRGMVVQKDLANKKVIFATDQTGLYFVDKDSQPTGLMGYEGELSEYDERLEKIAKGERPQLEKMFSGERYATDQIVTEGLTVGDKLDAGTDGKLVKAAVDSASVLVYGGTYNDNGHVLGIVQVL